MEVGYKNNEDGSESAISFFSILDVVLQPRNPLFKIQQLSFSFKEFFAVLMNMICFRIHLIGTQMN